MEPSKAAMERACILSNEQDPLANWKVDNFDDGTFIPGSMKALCYFIDTVDRVARDVLMLCDPKSDKAFILRTKLMLPDEPDPLAKAMEEAFGHAAGMFFTDKLRAALTAAGLKIVKEVE